MIALGPIPYCWSGLFYALRRQESGCRQPVDLIEKEMKAAMTLTGAKSISEISGDSLVQELGKSLFAALAPRAKAMPLERPARGEPGNFAILPRHLRGIGV